MNQTGRCILVVEDDPDTRDIITMQLKHAGYEVASFWHGHDALAWLADHRPDLVLLDWMLPDMSGPTIAQHIRSQYSLVSLPILMLSALGGLASRRVEGMQAGANDFLAKPYDSRELITRVEMLLAMSIQANQAAGDMHGYLSRTLEKHAHSDPGLLDRREERSAVIMFADLRGFTPVSAEMPADDMAALLDEFFTRMTRIIEDHGGVVLDLIGDELLAAFNVPYDLPLAGYLGVRAALEMQRCFVDVRAPFTDPGYHIGLGIGLHRGDVLLGNVGSSGLKRYTVLGQPVNLAKRLVDLAEDGRIIFSEEIYQEVRGVLPTIDMLRLPATSLKGFSGEMAVYQITV